MDSNRAPLNILQLTTSSDIGGTESMVLKLASNMDRGRFEVSVASLEGGERLTDACLANEIRAWTWHAGRPWPWNVARVASWAGQMRRYGFDLIHTYGLQADLVGRALKRRIGARRLVSGVRSAGAGRSGFQRFLERSTRGSVDLYIANSEAGRLDRIESEGVEPGRIRTIHNGIDLEDPAAGSVSRAQMRRELELREDDFPVIAHVANLRPMKGHAEAIQAARTLFEKWPKAVFLFAGRDDSGGAVPDEARGFPPGRVRFLGFTPNPRQILRAADIAILPSYYEGCPVSILEAMAESRPIVASNAGGIPELARHEQEALLIPPRDDGALASALLRLAENERMRQELGAAGRARVVAEFGMRKMVNRYEEIYAELCK